MSRRRYIIMIIIVFLFAISIILSIYYYNGKYVISFETGSDDFILNQYVKKNGKVKEPLVPNKDGYVFIEWQLDGKKYDFDTKIKKNTNLTAKWMKEEYITISYDSNSNFQIDSQEILKGSSIDKLPEPIKENHKFIGWFLNDKLYNNEELYSDTELFAHYEEVLIEPNFKVGDVVLISGNYSESAFSNNARHSEAIGWKRKILKIYEGTNYPYMVGNSTGVTGFFSINSIK